MKKYAILTSVLALAACGGGSSHHGGGAAQIGPDAPIVAPGAVTDPEIIKNNKTVTHLAEIDNRAEIVAYVESKLGSDYYEMPDGTTNVSRATTSGAAVRSVADKLSLDEKYRQASQKLDNMNKTLSEMLNSAADAAAEYIAENSERVIEALKLFGAKIDEKIETAEEIKKIFDENVTADELKKVVEDNTLHVVRLDDITFRMATNEHDWFQKMKLKTDGGKIVGATMFGNDGEGVTKRIGDTSEFLYTFYDYGISVKDIEGVNRDSIEMEDPITEELSLADMKAKLKEYATQKYEEGEMTDDGYEQVLARIDGLKESDRNKDGGFYADKIGVKFGFNMLGESVGLKYSDFGYISQKYQVNDGEFIDEGIEGIAGGYDFKRIDKSDLKEEMVFAGRAVGNVSYHNEETDPEGNVSKNLDTSDAKLTFKDGVETLNMNFAKDGWYNVTVTSDKDSNMAIAFDAAGQNIDKKLQFHSSEYKNVSSDDVNFLTPDEPGQSGVTHIKYYGDNGNPSEATATVFFEEYALRYNGDVTPDNVEFGAAFGGKR